MTDLLRRFRGLGVALVVLALSAGAVFATAPRFSPAADGEPGIEQPDGDPAATDDADSPDEDGDEDEAGDDADTDAGAGDEADADADAAAGDTHGALVSEAAQASLDPRFDNRGEWVSCVAKLDKTVTLGTVDWAQVTEDCATAAEAKDAAKEAAAAARDEAKAARAEAKAAREAARAEAKAERQAAKGQAKSHGKHGKPAG